ncbi:StlD/DarB family beta-ketosynthase, partial [Desulfotalea psychrophila]|nr:StlD/DarB family beta-ketosynthase [Desulfotalea psychrophila]
MPQQVFINHISAFLPNQPVSNDAMESLLMPVATRPSRVRKLILRSNKISSRYYAIDPETGLASHNNAQLTAEAVRKLGTQTELDTIELLACGTTLPDQIMPNHALMVHGELGIPPCEAIATAGVCLAGTMSLKYVYMAILSGLNSNGVATGSENVSSLLRGHLFTEEMALQGKELEKNPELAFEKDFLRWMLSDGAGAVWMSNKPNSDSGSISLRIDWIHQKSYAGELDTCMYAGAMKMEDGSLRGWREYLPQEWLEHSLFSIKQDVKLLNDKIIEYTVTRPLRELVKQGQVDPEQIDWFLPHYSSGFFRDKVHEGIQL